MRTMFTPLTFIAVAKPSAAIEQFAEAFRHYLPEFPTRERASVRKKNDRHGKRSKRRTVARLEGLTNDNTARRSRAERFMRRK